MIGPLGRKKKKSDSGPNLLFQSWITEAMENAFAKDAKSYYAYRKALSSLKKYPLLLQSGKDCKILEGFGVKLCDLLDEKLNNYAKDLQLPVLEALHYGNKSLKASKTLLTITKSCQINQLSAEKEVPLKELNIILTNNDVSSPDSIVLQTNSTDRVNFETTNGQNSVFQYSDWARKILDVIKSSKHPLGCSMCELSTYFRNHDLTDPQLLQSELNKLVDMKIVQYITDSPARFKITDADPNITTSVFSKSEMSHNYPSEISLDAKCSIDSSLSFSCTSQISSSYALHFTYVDENNNPVHHKQNAHQREYTLDGVTISGFRIRCIYEDLIISGVSYRIDWSSPGLTENDITYTYAYLLDPNAPSLCTNPIPSIKSADTTSSVHTTISSKTVTKSSITSDFTFKPMPKVNSINLETGIKRCKSQESVSSDGSINKSSRVCANFLMPETTIPLGYPTQSQPILARQLSLGCTPHIPSLTHDPANYNPPTFGEPLISQSISCSDPINVQLQTSTQIPLIVPGNSYEIILLADVRENFGSNKVRQMLPTVFQKYHIKCESRALPVGDFLWIARWRNESDCLMEAVLNQIVERKRMDDLAHSIVDGRFMEQKYRLKRTGLLQLMYLIEECPMMHNQKVSYDVLIQAISNSQMIDGLQIMTTKGPEDTVDLLAALSQRLQSRASNDLYVNHKSTDISCKPNTVNALSWCEFVKLANKSPDPSIRDIFAKYLMQIPGCSGSKVTSIMEKYPTPSILMEAYDKQLTALDKDNMLADLKPADSNRCLGTAFSRRISLAFNTL
ncbi:Crossover junction endonuclease MUS81 [Schistosoma japonicum]|nr:Crossover junction endonuclease MUS81 [Schistosoma japonicum]